MASKAFQILQPHKAEVDEKIVAIIMAYGPQRSWVQLSQT